MDSLSSWPGNGNYGDLADFTQPVAVMTRDAVLNTSLRYYSGYVSDTLTFGNLTVNAGVRYDNQQGHNLASTTPANPVIPDLLPGITTPNEPAAFTWENVVPRIGATYALGKEQQDAAARELLAVRRPARRRRHRLQQPRRAVGGSTTTGTTSTTTTSSRATS